MAIGTTPLFSEISGSAGPVDFRTRRNGKIEIGKKRIPANPQSTRQLEVRAGYGRLHELWQNASYIDKTQYEKMADIQQISLWNTWLQAHMPTMNIDPAFYWPGVEGTNNTLHNLTKNTSDGTISGMTWTELNSGLWTLYSDGIDDGITAADNPLHSLDTDLTIKSWFCARPQTINYMRLIHKGGWKHGGYSLQQKSIGDDKLILLFGSDVGWSGPGSANLPYSPNEWFMATFTIKAGGNVTTYKNNTLIGQVATPTIFPTILPLKFGDSPNPSFKGSCALIVIDNKEWSIETIKKIYSVEKNYFSL